MKKSILYSILLFTGMLFSFTTVASHFRYGDISWRVVESDPSGRTIEFKVNTGWRLNATNTPYLYFGDGTGSSMSYTTTNINGEYSYLTATVTHTYSSNGNFTAYYSGCCKISNLSNNSDDNWYVRTNVTVGSGNSSPVTTVPAVVNVQTNQTAATFNIPAADPDGDNLTFSLASYGAHGWPNGSTHPSGISINSTTGQVTFNTIGKSIGSLWNTAVAISDGNTTIIVDYIIKITQTSTPPLFDYSVTPTNNYIYNASPGQNVTFSLSAYDNDPGSTVNISALGVPAGAAVSPSFGSSGNPVTHSFSWTPTASQFGTYVMNFIAQDNNGVQAQTSVSIIVSLKPQFDVPPTPAQGVHRVDTPGTHIVYTVQASDPDPADLVQINLVQGKDMSGNKIALYSGASFSPLPTASGNPTSGTFTWTPQASDWGHKHVFFTAEDSYGDKAIHEVSQLINSNPEFTSTPVINALLGEPYVYNIVATDADLPYGDMLAIVGANIPSWLTLIDNGNGMATLSGTPTLGDVGISNVDLMAEDMHHHEYLDQVPHQMFDIEVVDCNVNAISQNFTAFLDASGIAQITATDIDGGSTASCGISSLACSSPAAILSSSTNLAKGTFSGGQAEVIEYSNYNAPNYSGSSLGTSCVQSWHPRGSLCDEGIYADNPDTSYRTTNNAGATWRNNSAGSSYGILVIDLGSIQSVDSMSIFQMFSDGKATHVEAYAYSGSGVPSSTSAGWSQLFPFTAVGPGAYSGTVVTKPLKLGFTKTDTRYIKLYVKNDGSLGFGTWIELRQIKLFNSSTPCSFDCSALGTNAVTLTATDVNGNVDSATATLTVLDTISPIMVTNSMTINLVDRNDYILSQAEIDQLGANSSDNCGVNFSISNHAFNCDDKDQTFTLTLTGTDLSGNTASVPVQITVLDPNSVCNDPPTAVCQNITVYTNANCEASIAAADVDGGSTDPDGDVLTYSLDNYGPFGVGTLTVTFTVSDGEYSDSCSATITVQDATLPTVSTQNITVQLDSTGSAAITASQIDNGSSDACGIAALSVQPSTFNCSNVGANTVTLTVTDVNGNISTAPAVVTVEDHVAPTAAAQNIVVQLDANGHVSVPVSVVDNGSADNCSIASIAFESPVVTGQVYAEVIEGQTLTLTAPVGAVFTSVDFASYGLPYGSNGSYSTGGCHAVNSQSAVEAVALGNNSFSIAATNGVFGDPCNGITKRLFVLATYTSGSGSGVLGTGNTTISYNCGDIGQNQVTMLVTDVNGNTSTANATITVEDNVAPVALAQNITIQLDASGNASITAADVDGGSNDACGVASMSVLPSTFNCSNVGANTVTLTVIDVNGNTSTANATVTIGDNIAPTINTQDVTVYLDSIGQASITTADIDSGSTDACGIATLNVNSSTFDCSHVGGSSTVSLKSDTSWRESTVLDMVSNNTFPWTGTASIPAANTFTNNVTLGQPYNRTWTHIAAIPGTEIIRCGNYVRYYRNTINLSSASSATGHFRVRVDDDMEIYINGTLVAGEYSGNAENYKGVAHELYYDANGATNGYNGGDAFDSVYVSDLSTVLQSGTNEVILAVRNKKGSDEGGFTFLMDISTAGGVPVTLTATDVNGNSASATANVTVLDTVSPSITNMPTDMTVYTTTDTCRPRAFWALPAKYDACGIQNWVYNESPGNSFGVGVHTVSYTATDMSGNTTTKSFNITVVDTTAPTMICKNITVQLDGNGAASIAYTDVDNGTNDPCGIASMSIDVSTFSCADLGQNAVTLSATDIYGNTANCTATVTVEDHVLPTAVAQNVVVTIDSATGIGQLTAAEVNNGSSDNCGVASISIDKVTFSCPEASDVETVTLTVTDNSGNISSTTAQVSFNGIDTDGDGIFDYCDSCPFDPENDADGDGVCGDVDGCPYTPNTAITLDYTYDGAGEYCWVTDGNIDHINSWNLEELEVNGVAYTNQWSTVMPPRIDGKYFFHYRSNVPWGHFEVYGTQPSGNNVCANPVSVNINFTKDGVGTHCYVTTDNIDFVNSWNMDKIEINGVDYTNQYSNSLPAKINGAYEIYYETQYPWGHFEAKSYNARTSNDSGSANEESASKTQLVGVEDLESPILKVYPNPTNGMVTVFMSEVLSSNVEMVLTDLSGKILEHFKTDSGNLTYQLNLSAYTSGVYIIKVNTAKGIYTEKVIKR